MSLGPVPPPIWQADLAEPAAIRADVDRWLTSSPIGALVERFGGDNETTDMDSRLLYLDRFSAAHWDFRNGAERHAVGATELDPETSATVDDAVAALGMDIDSTKSVFGRFTHVLIPGGLLRACMVRPMRAAQLLKGQIESHSVAGLTALRPLSASEAELAERIGLRDVGSELDAMDAGMQLAFPPHSGVQHDSSSSSEGFWLVRSWSDGATGDVSVVLAPPAVSTRSRANTADTFSFWARRALPIAGDRLLVVTSAIYAPYQHLEAVRVLGLPYGCEISTVGIALDAPDLGPLRQTFTQREYLQEIRSTIRACADLVATLGEPQ